MRESIIKNINNKFKKDFTKYVDFCINNKYEVEDEIYCEIHHILPRSKFPEFKNEKWNLVRLKYADHTKAHLILAEIHPIKSFIKPLTFLANIDEEIREKIPMLQAQGIDEWRKTDKYKKFVENCSKRGKNKFKDQNERDKLSEKCKSTWNKKSEEEKQKHIAERSAYNKSDAGRKKNSEGVRRAYADGTLGRKLSEISKGKVWWNNGSNETKSFDQPDVDWVRGRITKFTEEQVKKRNKTLEEKKRNANGK